ncbi:hypothetical protein HC341_06495 [Aquisalimonas sp. 2447]|uniref:hypothetical protein n=1 Tax=Aquisalimonas sp. 2447 TaxID=2740807 RepID=UPI0014325709|nr:hypothetical protein [Aquisalimonas sp. 2447]QIT54895.1 hypothetical protein HC341_06495 [Aquisalimonas sp. 2447]
MMSPDGNDDKRPFSSFQRRDLVRREQDAGDAGPAVRATKKGSSADAAPLIEALEAIIDHAGRGSHVGQMAKQGLDAYHMGHLRVASLPRVDRLCGASDWPVVVRGEIQKLQTLGRSLHASADNPAAVLDRLDVAVDDVLSWLQDAIDVIAVQIAITNSDRRSVHDLLGNMATHVHQGLRDDLSEQRRRNSFERFSDLAESLDQEMARWSSLPTQ